MRIRNNTTYQTIPTTYVHFGSPGGGTPVPQLIGESFDALKTFSYIEDEPRGAFGRFHKVNHKKFTREMKPYAQLFSWGAGYTHNFEPYSWVRAFHGAVGLNTAFEAEVPPVRWESYKEEAYQAMNPMKSDLSLVNFVLELKDLPRLLDIASKWRSDIANLGNAHLNVQFGWVPLIKDMNVLLPALREFGEKYRALELMADQPQTRHWSVQLGKTRLEETAPGHIPASLWAQGHYETEVSPAKYTATMRFVYTIPPEGKYISNKVKFYLDLLGVRPDATIIWNAIPYSFCVDWVLNVSGWLNSLSAYNLALGVRIDDFCHSIKTETVRRMFVEPAFYPYDGSNTVGEVVVERATRYIRLPTLPSGVLTIRSRSPSFGAVALGAALLATRMPK